MTHYGPEPLPDRDPTPPDDDDDFEDRCECGHRRSAHANGTWECRWCRCKGYQVPKIPDIFDDELGADYPPHDPDADPCRCVDCSEAAWDRLQEAQAESPSEWNLAYKGPIDKREMRRRE